MDLHMSPQGRGIGHDDMVPENTVMGNMGIGHKKIVAADGRYPASRRGTSMNGNIFADLIVVADNKFGWFTLIVQILRRAAHRGKRADNITAADRGVSSQNGMRHYPCQRSDSDAGLDDGIGADLDGSIEAGLLVNNCSGMNRHG